MDRDGIHRPRPWGAGSGGGALLCALLVSVAATGPTFHPLGAQDSSTGGAAAARPEARAVRASGPIAVDGVLDDVEWQDAPILTDFVQREPVEGVLASQRTEVRFLYSDDALYVGAWLFDTTTDRMVVGERTRDADLAEGDAFIMVLDTFRDGQNGFLFGTNPQGIEYDGHITMDGHPGASGQFRENTSAGFNINWDGSWTVATSRDSAGWYAEMRIPFSTLRFAGGADATWGLNLGRRIRRENEEAFWAPIARQHSIHRVSMAGALSGMDLPVQRTLAVTPYLLQEARRDVSPSAGADAWEEEGVRYPADAGLDVKVGLTSSVTMDLTYNTDFAQVEVDDQRIDLNRFNLFFPEKRPFFLENAGLFSVGAPGWLELFYSRRIGIGVGGQEVPIRGGGRITGTMGAFNGGLLHIETGGVEGVAPGNRYTVGRLQRQFQGNSRVGVLYTARVASEDPSDDNHLINLDGRYWFGESTFVEGYVAATRTPGLQGREHSYYINLSHEGAHWLPRVSYMETGDHFNPEVGFVSRVGFRVPTVSLQRRLRVPSVSWLREIRPQLHYNGFYDLDGFLETHSASLRTRLELENGAFLLSSVSHSIEGLKDPFAIHPGVEIPAGSYENLQTSVQFRTNASAPVALGGTLNAGGFFSGSRLGGSANLALRHGAAFTGEFRAGYNRVELPEGGFDTHLVGLTLGFAPTPSLSLRSLVQYSSQANLWTTNVRLGWLHAAGTGLFLVFNDSRQTGTSAGTLHRGVTLKYTRQFELAW